MTHLPAFRNIESLLPEGTLHVAAIEVQSGKNLVVSERYPGIHGKYYQTADTHPYRHAGQVMASLPGTPTNTCAKRRFSLVEWGFSDTMHTPGTVRLDDACYLMTALSDNTATNLVLDQTGIEPVNATL